MITYETQLRSGITRTKEFERKGLASYAVNVGTKCGHGCLYCSSGALLRMHPSFRQHGRNSFETGRAIVEQITQQPIVRNDSWISDRRWHLPSTAAKVHIEGPFLEICKEHGVLAKHCKRNLIETS